MKTLRNEWDRLGRTGALHGTHYDEFMDEYGDWRVVEGELRVDTRVHLRRPEVIIDADDQWHYPFGESGDHVKLILPPEGEDVAAERMRCACDMYMTNKWTQEDCRKVWRGEDRTPLEEKKGLGAKVALDMAMQFVDMERERADRYEKALRTILDNEEDASEVFDLAREALDDGE